MPIDRRTSPDSVAVTPKAIKWVETTPSRLSQFVSTVGLLWYNVLLVLILLVSTAIIMPASLIISPTALGRVCRNVFLATARLQLSLSPHVSVRTDAKSIDYSALGSSGRPVMLLVNHNSFFDFFALLALVPWSICARARMLVSSGLYKLPLFGRVVQAGEAIPVFFKIHDEQKKAEAVVNTADFEVAKDKAHITAGLMAKQLSSGNILMLFPEGRLNPQAGGNIQPFRFGAFEVAREHDVELWGLCMTGCERVWPSTAACGGHPATVVGRLFPIAPRGARALCEAFPIGASTDKTPTQVLADFARAEFQRTLDDLRE